MNEGPRYVSHTQRLVLQQCPQKYAYRYQLGLDDGDDVGNEARYSRSAVHPLVQRLHRGREPDTPSLWQAYQTDLTDPLDGARTPHLSPGALERMASLYRAHVEALREDGWRCVGSEVQVERTVLPENVGSLPYFGYLDVLEEREEERLGVEVKFSTQRQSAEAVYAIDQQVLGYAIAARCSRMRVVEIRLTKATKAALTVLVHDVTIAEDQRRLWLSGYASDVAEISRARRSGVWPMHASPATCLAWGRPCGFLPLCQAGALKQELMDRWPRKRRGGKKEEEYV